MLEIQPFFQLSSNFIFAAFILQSDSWPTEFCFHQPYHRHYCDCMLYFKMNEQDCAGHTGCQSDWSIFCAQGKSPVWTKRQTEVQLSQFFAPIIRTNYQITLMQPGSSVTFISFCSVLLLIFELQQRNESGPISPYSTLWDIAEWNLSQIRQDPSQGIILRI